MNPPPADFPEQASRQDEASRSAHRALSRREVVAILGGVMLAMFLGALNQTIVATPLPTIGRAFGDFENLSWVILAFLLTSTAVAPLYGKLSDIYGRRHMMLAAILIFMAGSIVCGAAPNMVTLILGRALQGVGGGGIVPLSQSIIADAVPPRERGHYQAYTGSVWIVAGGGGPVIGGLIAEHLNWSLIFWLNVPLSIVAAVLCHRLLRRLPRHDRRHKLDVVGAVLMMTAAVALLLALNWGGTRYPWLSWQIVALLAAAGALSAAFIWWVLRVPEPFLPIAVMNNPVMRIGTVASSCSQGVSIGLTIFMPLYFELVHKLSATDSGLALIPIVMLTTPGSFLSGRFMIHTAHYKRFSILMMGAATLATAALAFFPVMPLWGVIAVMCLVGLGTGSSYPVVTVSIQNAVSHAQVGIAMGAMNFFRQLASTLVVAIMGAIMLAHLGAAPQRGASPALVAVATTASSAELTQMFRWIFIVATAVSALCVLALILMEERPLRAYVVAPPIVPDAPARPAE
jgi:EmrB/QacA subfamily drug resistance transporter